MTARTTDEVLQDIRILVKQKGYIYALCMILMDDFHINILELDNVNYRSRLSKNEVQLILGFLIQDIVSEEPPESPLSLLEYKKRTYKLFEELHHSTMQPLFQRFKETLNMEGDTPSIIPHPKSIFTGPNLFIEPIFYAGDGIYDFQYAEFLPRKYRYDEEWLELNHNFKFSEVTNTLFKIKSIHQEKIKSIAFLNVKENRSEIIKHIKKFPGVSNKTIKDKRDEIFSHLEFFQFYDLFNLDENSHTNSHLHSLPDQAWQSFYSGLLDIFSVSASDFDNSHNIDSFLKNFTLPNPSEGRNREFQKIGDYNLFSSNPIIQISSDRYFIPITFSLFEAAYESPYYWMLEDRSYKNTLAKNRGASGEEICFEILKGIFPKGNVLKSVRIESKKGNDVSDIDIFCVLGSKALCVQVKSKKLTQLSRKGNFDQLQKDFKGAVQDAYNQGINCRKHILEGVSTYYDESGNQVSLSESINEVYILSVTTENYPSLTHQASTLLSKHPEDPYPLVLTVFDLELIAFYLQNPYDFLYYIRQRIDLMDHFKANEEMHFLGYHLLHKLYRDPRYDYVAIDNDLGQIIDQNYYPLKLGITPPKEKDKLQSKWKNTDFELLCSEIVDLKFPKVTDIIFHLLDWSEDSIDNLIKHINQIRFQTLADGDTHNFSIMAGPNRSSFGITYISWHNHDLNSLSAQLEAHSKARKYKSRADFWVGIGCLKNSNRLVDTLCFSDSKWEYDEVLEKEIHGLFSGPNKGTYSNLGRKVGRNDFYPCGSGIKYKKCCGRKF